MTKVDTVLWDLDGTLIDSEHVQTEGAIFAAKEMGFKFTDWDMLDRGLDGVAVFEMMTGDKFGPHNKNLYKDWFSRAMNYVCENYYKSGQIPQTLELVREFGNLGIKQSIVSNSTSKVISHCIEELQIGKYITSFIGRDNVSQGKPSPEPYLKAIELNNTKAVNCLAFEDSEAGIQAAISAGIRVIGVGDHVHNLPITTDYICSLSVSSWINEIKNRYL